MLGVGVFDGHSGPEASKYVSEHLWNEVRTGIIRINSSGSSSTGINSGEDGYGGGGGGGGSSTR